MSVRGADGGPGAPTSRGEVWCVVVAGGSGRRFGSAKQFETLGTERVIDRSVCTAAEVCDGVVAVVPEAMLSALEEDLLSADVVVAGGSTRTESSRAGVSAVSAEASVILVHDAARPLASAEVFERVVEAVRAGAPAVVPVVDVTDTIRDADGALVDREQLRSVQTPQGFDAQVIRESLAAGVEATDDAGAAQAAGHRVHMVAGDPNNLKITTPADLLLARVLLEELTGCRPSSGGFGGGR